MDTYSLLYVIRGAKPFAPGYPQISHLSIRPQLSHFGLAFQSHATLIMNHNAKPFCSMTYSEIITVSYLKISRKCREQLPILLSQKFYR